jgi:hypothetical protein
MRRVHWLVVPVAAALPLFMVAGCEDGPNQTFNPAPRGAGQVWNGSGSTIPEGGSYSGNATTDYDASYGGQNANVTCTADQAKAIWGSLFQQPILPPGIAAGIDIAGGYASDGNATYTPGQPYQYDETKETWVGATLEQAEKILCSSITDSVYYGITTTAGWGESCPACEVSAFYNGASRKITDLLFQPGYLGTLNATSVDGKTQYQLGFQNQPISVVTSGGTQQFIMNWTDTTGAFQAAVNKMYDAYRNTYETTFPPDTDCVAAGHCIIGNNFTAGGYLFFTPLNLAIFVNNTTAPQPAASTIGLVDLGLLKLLPFSIGQTVMKLDAVGPINLTHNVANSGKDCTYSLGMSYGAFDSTCVQASSDPKQNLIAERKVLGAMSHSDEAYVFDILGADPQFAATLQPTDVIGDTQTPGANDVAYEYTVDQYVLGPIANDYVNNDATQAKDLHGLGMITLETAYLVQQFMQANHGVTADLGDPACIANPANPGVAGLVCSGLEGIITSAPASALPTTFADGQPAAQAAYNAQGVAAANIDPNYGIGLKPSTWAVDVCSGGTAAAPSGCQGGVHGGPLGGFYFDQMQASVASSFGTNPVPQDVASRRFYFKSFIEACIKYFQVVGTAGELSLAAVDASPVDDNEIFFDSAGGGFENGNYVFRNQVNTANQAPTLFNIGTNLTTSVLNNFTFDRFNFRGDSALYQVLNTNPVDKPGAEPLFLMNLAGSAVLSSVYPAYECAIDTAGTDPNCGGIKAPVDPFSNPPNQPLFAPYQAAFGQSFLHLAANGIPATASPMQVNPGDFEFIRSAMVSIPIWSNPFDPTSAEPGKDQTVSVLLSYVPEGAGGGGQAGFAVTFDGSRDKFYNTNELFFSSGQNIDGASTAITVDFENVAVNNIDGGTDNVTIVRALESQAYIGVIAACAQPMIDPTQTPGTQDILAVRMYDSAASILNWIATHPGSLAQCGVEIKYSIYGNFPDVISFNNNGMRFGLNPGFGGSVVADGTVFDPNVVATLGQ